MWCIQVLAHNAQWIGVALVWQADLAARVQEDLEYLQGFAARVIVS